MLFWMVGAAQFLPEIPELLRTILCAIIAFGVLLYFSRRRRPLATFVLGSSFIVLLFLFFATRPKNEKDWEVSAARIPQIEDISPNKLEIRGIRDFRYRSETDYDVRYYDRTVDLDQLTSVDFFVSYWAGKPLAHIIVSFGFSDRDYVAFSIETRKEKPEAWSTFAGFYRNYEIMYVAADERDVISLRTKVRNPAEQVYLLRTRMPIVNARKLFRQYAYKINSLNKIPEFYNTLTTNCTTQILTHVQAYNRTLHYNWKIFLSGYLPEYLFELGALDTSRPFSELFAASLINQRANVDVESDGFSQRIREGLPNPEKLVISE